MFENFEEMEAIVKQAKNSLTEEDLDYSQFEDEDISYSNNENTNSDSDIDYDSIAYTDMPTLDRYTDETNDIQLEEYDTPIFAGGPSVTQLKLWKKQFAGYDIYVTEILDETFVFRTLNRFEYKQLILLENIDAMQREEIICNTVTLWPQGYSWGEMAKVKAGIPSTYSDIIMEKSGFTKDYAIRMI